MTWSEEELRFILEVRNIVDNLDRGGTSSVHMAMRRFDEIGAVPGIHVGKSGMTQFEIVQWYAGQVMDAINAKAWEVMGQILNAIDLYVPSPVAEPLPLAVEPVRDASTDAVEEALALFEPLEGAERGELLQYLRPVQNARHRLGNLLALIENKHFADPKHSVEVLRADWEILHARECRTLERLKVTGWR